MRFQVLLGSKLNVRQDRAMAQRTSNPLRPIQAEESVMKGKVVYDEVVVILGCPDLIVCVLVALHVEDHLAPAQVGE